MDLGFLEPLTEQTTEMWVAFVKMLPLFGIALVVLFMTSVVNKIAKFLLGKILDKSQLRASLKSLFSTLLGIAIWVLGVLIAMAVIMPSLTPAKILAGLGLGSIAIGFAFQDIFENFLAGIMIMLRRNMRIGDFIECEGMLGKIEKINIRDTQLRQSDNQLIMVPNSILFKNPVYILTESKKRRFDLVCGVSYDTDLEKAEKVILKALEGLDLLDKKQEVQVFASEFNSSSVDFTIRWWADSKPVDLFKSRAQVIKSVKSALDKAGIEIPFPYITHTYKEEMPVAPIRFKEAKARQVKKKA